MDTQLASCTDAAALAAAIAHRCPQARQHGDQWQACCPAHDDHTPSLSITPAPDKVLLYQPFPPSLHAQPGQRRPHGRRPPAPLETCFRAHPVRYADGIAQRIQAIQAATPLTTDAGVIAPNALLVQALLAPRHATLQAIAACDSAIAPRPQRHPAFALFQALPGAGPVCAPRLLVAFGAQRERSPSAAALQP